MTEAEWLGCTEVESMLAYLDGRASDRKLRLFACAGSRRVWPTMDWQAQRRLQLGEEYLDGTVDVKAWRALCQGASERLRESIMVYDPGYCVCNPSAFDAARGAVAPGIARNVAERAAQSRLLRDIFGVPSRRIAINPNWLGWNDKVIVKLARVVYEERQLPAGTLDNTRLSVLADALEEAGCASADILNHCRQPGEHVRGCWVIDALLGKN